MANEDLAQNVDHTQEVCLEDWIVIEDTDVPSQESSVEALLRPDTAEPPQVTLDSSFASDIEEYFKDPLLSDPFVQHLSTIEPEWSQEEEESLDEEEEDLKTSEEEEESEASEEEEDFMTSEEEEDSEASDSDEEEPRFDQVIHPTLKNHLKMHSDWTRKKADSSSVMLWIFIISLITCFSLLLVNVRMETPNMLSKRNLCMATTKLKTLEMELDDLRKANSELRGVNYHLKEHHSDIYKSNIKLHNELYHLKLAQEDSQWLPIAIQNLVAHNKGFEIKNSNLKAEIEDVELEIWHTKKRFAATTKEVEVFTKAAKDNEELARSNKQLLSYTTDLKYQLQKERKKLEDIVQNSGRVYTCVKKFPSFRARLACISEAILDKARKQLIDLLGGKA